MKWLNSLKFWTTRTVPVTPKPIIVELIKEPELTPVPTIVEPDLEQIIVARWNSIVFPDTYYGHPTTEAIVNDFKQVLVKEYGMRYLASGGSSNVYISKDDKFVVKLCQVMGESTPFSAYQNYSKTTDEIPNWPDRADAYNYQQIKRIYREHVLHPNLVANNFYLCTQKYIKQDDNGNQKIMNYFDNLLGNFQIQGWRRKVNWRDLAPINNICWDDETNRAYIIDM